jgi:UDP-3-O-[3-hydroxymyristoyl] glucosamine N-acyltransferase
MPITLSDIARVISCPAPAQRGDMVITGVATLKEARPGELSFIGSDAFARDLATTKASVVIVRRSLKTRPASSAITFVVEDADLAIAAVLQLFAPSVPRPPVGRDPLCRIDPTAKVDDSVAIGPFVVVGARTTIGPGSVLHGGVTIGADVVIGRQCELFSHVVIRERISIGDRVTIHAGSVLGTDGFGYRWDGRQHAKIPHVGTVIVENDVEIGSCVCIDRAKFSATRIGQGTKIDNLVQIAHNVVIGPHCLIVGQVGLAGSAHLGTGVVLGGQVAVRDHITIGDGVMAAARSAIANDIDPGTVISGVPALPHRQNLREQAAIRRLPALVMQMRKLQEEIERLGKRL